MVKNSSMFLVGWRECNLYETKASFPPSSLSLSGSRCSGVKVEPDKLDSIGYRLRFNYNVRARERERICVDATTHVFILM